MNALIDLSHFLLGSISVYAVVEFFLWLLLALFIFSFLFSISEQADRLVRQAAGLMLGAGILGTLIVIVISSFDFDPHRLRQSLIQISPNLKLALLPLLAGLTSAMLFKFLSSLPGFSDGQKSNSLEVLQALRTDMQHQFEEEKQNWQHSLKVLNALNAASDRQKNGHESILNYLDQINQAIQSIHAFNQSNQAVLERWDALLRHFDEYQQTLSKQSKQWQSALEFNQNQIDALKQHLNDLPALYTQFKSQIESLGHAVMENQKNIQHNLQEQNQKMLGQLAKSYQSLLEKSAAQNSENLQKLAEMVEQINQNWQSQLQNIEQQNQQNLNQQSALMDQIDQGWQSIQKGLNEWQHTMQIYQKQWMQSIEPLSSSLQTLAEQWHQNSQNMTAHWQNMAESIEHVLHQIPAQWADAAKKIQSQWQSLAEQAWQAQQKAMQQAMEQIDHLIEQSVQKTEAHLDQHWQQFDQSMQAEVQRVINEMGQALAQISQRFSEDYNQLLGALYQLMRAEKQNG